MAGSIVPLGSRPARFWKVVSPARVSGPVDAVDGCRILAVRPQGHLEGGDAGAARGRGGARDGECHAKRSEQHEDAVHTSSVGTSGPRLKPD